MNTPLPWLNDMEDNTKHYNTMAKIYTLQQKEQVRDALRKLHNDSGLTASAFSERVGFSNPSVLAQFYNNIDLIGQKAMEVAQTYINKNMYVGVVTDNYVRVFDAMENAYVQKAVSVIIGNGGYGKSFAIEKYRARKEKETSGKTQVYIANMEGVPSKKACVRTLLEAVGLPIDKKSSKEQIAQLREYLAAKDCLLVMDEVSSLENTKVTILKDILTSLRGVCGLVVAGTPYFLENINKHAAKNAHLFSELADRLPVPVLLNAPTDKEAEAIFKHNGCDDVEIAILMGQTDDKYKWMCWRNKPTFRGISDGILLIKSPKSASKYNLDKLSAI